MARELVHALSHRKSHAPDEQSVLAAIDLHERVSLSLWDAMILHSATTSGCETLYTEDLNADQSYDGVMVNDPFEDV